MITEIKVQARSSKYYDRVWQRLSIVQDETSLELLRRAAKVIIEEAKKILDSPVDILAIDDRQGREGLTSSSSVRVHPVGNPIYNTMIKDSFSTNERGSNQYNRNVTISNDAPYSAHVHQGSNRAEVAAYAQDLIYRLKSWASKKDPASFNDYGIQALYEIILENGVPPLPYLRSATYKVMNEMQEEWLDTLRERIRTALAKT